MKNWMTLLFLVFARLAFAQQEALPISQTGLWIIGSGTWNVATGSFEYNTPSGLVVTDSISVSDTTYLQFSHVEHCIGGTVYSPEFLLREEDGKYFYRTSTTASESLWFDFNLEVGDTLSLGNCWTPQELVSLTVIDIQPITLGDGVERRKWTLQYMEDVPGLAFQTEEWIEGIGNTRQGWRHPLSATCIDLQSWLRCYYENGAWVENFEPLMAGTTCCSIVSVEEQTSHQNILYPNPATQFVRVESGQPISHIEIFDYTGQHIFTQTTIGSEKTVNIEFLAAGYYFAVIRTHDGKMQTAKFQKE